MSPSFWRGKRVLVTGHTGFKGSWLTLWLAEMGARVVGLALPPDGDFDLFARAGIGSACESRMVDLRDREAVVAAVAAARPEFVFHLAAQPLVRESYRRPVDTWSTNVMGTTHLMDALRSAADLVALVAVTSDKCYANDGQGRPFVETDALGGHDPYSASKAATEMVVASFATSFFHDRPVGIATARAGNVIGGGDGAPDRLIPDLVRGALAGQSIAIRSPRAVRPWQHVIDPLRGYLMLAEAMALDARRHGGAWNFGPDAEGTITVSEIATRFSSRFAASFGRGVRWHDAEDRSLHEAATLTLDSGKAARQFGWHRRISTDHAIALTADAYRILIDGGDVRATMLEQIEALNATDEVPA